MLRLDDAMDHGSITLDGGAGDDSYDLGSGAVAVTIEINAGDFSVASAAVTDGTIAPADAESITDFVSANDLIDLSSLGLSGTIFVEDGGGVLATALSQAYGEINSGSYDVVYVDLAGDANSVDYIFYDNGASGVGVLDLGTSTTLSTTLGDDILI